MHAKEYCELANEKETVLMCIIFPGILAVFIVATIALVFRRAAVIRQTHVGYVYVVLLGLLLGYVIVQKESCGVRCLCVRMVVVQIQGKCVNVRI